MKPKKKELFKYHPLLNMQKEIEKLVYNKCCDDWEKWLSSVCRRCSNNLKKGEVYFCKECGDLERKVCNEA